MNVLYPPYAVLEGADAAPNGALPLGAIILLAGQPTPDRIAAAKLAAQRNPWCPVIATIPGDGPDGTEQILRVLIPRVAVLRGTPDQDTKTLRDAVRNRPFSPEDLHDWLVLRLGGGRPAELLQAALSHEP